MRGKNSPLKFTELFQETGGTNATQGLQVALENSSVKCLLRSYRCATYCKPRKLRNFNIQEYRCEVYVSYRFQLKFCRTR